MKSVYTTGEVAQICKVSQQTVIRCFDSGKLRGFRVPGSRFRRIPWEALVEFMRDHDIPIDALETGKRRVLVVDDDTAVVEMVSELLGRDGRFEVRTATTGYDAGLTTHEFRPDVMLLDFKLPDINGNVVCKTVRSHPHFQHMRIIMMSGVENPVEVEEMMKAGADDFIKKPFDVGVVINRITELLKL